MNGISPPLDLHDFRRRAEPIREARAQASKNARDHALAEADAEHDYRVEKARRLEVLRADGKAQDEALALAEGDSLVARHKQTRDREAAYKRFAQMRVEECERNASMLNREAVMGEGIEG